MVSSIMKSDGEGSTGNASEWDYIVRIILLEGTGLLSMDDNGLSDPYVRFKLQHEKHKTKVCLFVSLSHLDRQPKLVISWMWQQNIAQSCY